MDYNNLGSNVSVHGGVTFSGHLIELGNKWVFGYDCAHYGDKTLCPPELLNLGLEDMFSDGIWRDEDFCIEGCESLAKQLKLLGDGYE